MNIFRRGRALSIAIKKRKGKEIPQEVIEVSTSGKMTKTREGVGGEREWRGGSGGEGREWWAGSGGAGSSSPFEHAGSSPLFTRAGPLSPFMHAGPSLPFACAGPLSPFACAGASSPFACAGPLSLFPRAGLSLPFACAGVGTSSGRRPSCSSVACGRLAGRLWVVVVVAAFASPLSIVVVACIVDA